ncbi:hypothetical protein BGX23_003936 [Mortierella sp. AD031]|nr:hypothetical protein BGX23_003936 [Mortierella sp. AD031]KAG0218197.1 hypothetical protein BGX33_008215 [Mortierella sp. NVP41]
MKTSIFLALSAAWIPLAAHAIVNGRFATAPYLQGVVKVNHDCTGALIGNKCVLTAYHCLARGRRGKVMLPKFEDSVVIESTQKSTIVSSLAPEYSNRRCYDMAIAVLHESHNRGYNLTRTSVRGENVAAAGWGFVNDYTIPKALQFIQYIAKAKIVHSEGIVVPVADGASGIAFRDSGGPLFICNGDECHIVGVANGKAKGSSLMKTQHVWCDVRSNWAWIMRTLDTNCY